MAEESFEERTEEPSAKRRTEAREKGTVVKSTEANSVVVLLAGILLLKAFGPWMFAEIKSMFYSVYLSLHDPDMSQVAIVKRVSDTVFMTGRIMLPVIILILVAGVTANYLQIGFLLTFKPLVPSLDKINPLSGAKRLFSLRSIVELFKNIAKLTVIGWVAYLTISGSFTEFLTLAERSVGTIWLFMLQTGYNIVIRILLVLIIIAIIDYIYQKYEHEKNLKMTKQEVKEEHKQMEGDPQVKSRIRSLQREMARRRMMEEVPKATVVVTNPTYIAIAIQYQPQEMETPVVVAKGKRVIAQKIKDIAKENNIPVVEDKPLARAMYDKVEPGWEIPVEFFTAIAEILAYVYRLKNKAAA